MNLIGDRPLIFGDFLLLAILRQSKGVSSGS